MGFSSAVAGAQEEATEGEAFEQPASEGSGEDEAVAVLPPLAEVLTGDALKEYNAARLLFADGDYRGASAKFQHAYELEPDPRLLWNAAACEKEQRSYAGASQLIERYLEEGGDQLPEQSRASARETLEALRGFSSRVTLSGAPDGARVLVDGVVVATTPLEAPLHLDLGTRRLRVELRGHEPFEKALAIPGNTEIEIEVVLDPEPREVNLPEPIVRRSLLASKWPAFSAAGVGVAGAAVWAIFGTQSISAKSKSKGECEGNSCTARGVTFRQDAIDAGNVATVGMLVAGVGLASAAALWFALPTKKAESVSQYSPSKFMRVEQVRVGAGTGTIQLSGGW